MLFDSPPRDLVNFLKANATLGSSERYRLATKAEQYYLSLQYDGLDSWDSSKPLRKKKPRVIVPLYKTAIDTLHAFIWGGARFPKIIVQPTSKESDAVNNDEIGPNLNPEQAKDLNTFVNNLVKKGHLDEVIQEASKAALITTSCAIILGFRGGFLHSRVEPGKHCVPTFDPDNPRHIKSLEVKFQFEREEQSGLQGLAKKEIYWYRRVIDETNDTVYKPVKVAPGAFEPEWEVDPEASVQHSLGFCPVVWVRTLPSSSDAIDGQPVIDSSLYGMLDRINYTISQRDRAVEYSQDPQFVVKGVPTSQRNALQKHPGALWYVDKEADVDILEVTGNGQTTATEHLQDMRTKFLEACGVVLADPTWLRGSSNISGIVLEYLYAPMMSLAANLRKDLGDKAFIDLINVALRICMRCREQGKDVWIPGVNSVTKMMSKAQLQGVWLDFPVHLQWGPYFTPNAQDQQLKVATAVQGMVSGIISNHTATHYLSDVFSISDVDAEREQADKDHQERLDQQMQQSLTQPKGTASAKGYGNSGKRGDAVKSRPARRRAAPVDRDKDGIVEEGEDDYER